MKEEKQEDDWKTKVQEIAKSSKTKRATYLKVLIFLNP